MDRLLEIQGLRVSYRTERATVHAINGLNLSIGRGESLGLVGESGAGKTTLALASLNLLPERSAAVSGSIRYNGNPVFEMSERQLMSMRGGKISMIFQNPLTALNPVFTVGEQIAMVLRTHMKMNRRQAKARAGELMEMVGIAAFRYEDYPSQFSGGMRQRIGIAAGLACNPELLIADEPTTALDVTIQAQILELMKEMQQKYDTALLMITHNLGIVSELCRNVAVMYAGRIIEYGSSCEVFGAPAHPYTRGLLEALPGIDIRKEKLSAISGRVADPQNLPEGCYFHPRCTLCMGRCAFEKPELKKIGDNHYAACFAAEVTTDDGSN